MFQLYWICLPSHPSLPLVCMFVFVVSIWHLKSCRWPKLPWDPACYQSCGHGEEPATLPVEGAEAEVQPEEHPWLCSLKTVAQLDPAFPSRHRCGVTILSGSHWVCPRMDFVDPPPSNSIKHPRAHEGPQTQNKRYSPQRLALSSRTVTKDEISGPESRETVLVSAAQCNLVCRNETGAAMDMCCCRQVNSINAC